MNPSLVFRLGIAALLGSLLVPLVGYLSLRTGSDTLFFGVFVVPSLLALFALVVIGLGIAAIVQARRTGEPFTKAVVGVVLAALSIVATGFLAFASLLMMAPIGHGRPLRVRGAPRVAGSARRDDWCSALAPSLDGLDPETRAALAEGWRRDGLAEHASVASFARLALDLMELGAPSALVDAAHRAAREEVAHARDCFALASAYGGESVGPAPFSWARVIEGSATVAALAEGSLRDGVVDEAAAARVLRACADSATDPCVQAMLARTAADEQRHAELAWEVVLWAWRTDEASVAPALRQWLAANPALAAGPVAGDRHGRACAAAFDHARRAVLSETRARVLALLSARERGDASVAA